MALYRRALELRQELQTDETLEWCETGTDDVLAFRRPNGWLCVTNFGDAPADLPDGKVLASSDDLEGRSLPGGTTAWLLG